MLISFIIDWKKSIKIITFSPIAMFGDIKQNSIISFIRRLDRSTIEVMQELSIHSCNGFNWKAFAKTPFHDINERIQLQSNCKNCQKHSTDGYYSINTTTDSLVVFFFEEKIIWKVITNWKIIINNTIIANWIQL